MSLSFLSGHAFEVAHICCANRGSNNAKVVQLRCLLVALVVLKEKLQVLNVLVLDKPQCNGRAVQLIRSEPEN